MKKFLSVLALIVVACWLQWQATLPSLVVNPNFVITGSVPNEAAETVRYFLEHRKGGVLYHPQGKIVRVYVNLGKDPYGGFAPGYMSRDDPNALMLTFTVGEKQVEAYTLVHDLGELEGPVHVRQALFARAVEYAVGQIGAKEAGEDR